MVSQRGLFGSTLIMRRSNHFFYRRCYLMVCVCDHRGERRLTDSELLRRAGGVPNNAWVHVGKSGQNEADS